MLSAGSDIESREGGPTQIVLGFSEPVVSTGGGTIDCTDVTLSDGNCDLVAGSGTDTLAIALSGVSDDGCLSVAISNIEDAAGNALTDDDDVHEPQDR